jgi:DNA repair exonuclease SbcCD nuclease subunit
VAKVRGLAIGDIHYDASDPVKLYENLKKVFLKKIEDEGEDLDVIFLTGDLFHNKVSMNSVSGKMVLRFVYELLNLCKKFNIKVRAISGTRTHDFNQMDNFKPYELDYDFRVISKTEVEEIFPDMFVLFVPEEYMDDQKEYYKEFVGECDEETKYDMMIFHGTWDFVAFDDQISESERPIKGSPVFSFKEWSEYVWGPIMGGHIHTHYAYKNKVYYTSSFTRWVYGEPKPKGFLEFTYDTETLEYDVEFIENPMAPRFDTYRVDEVFDEGDTIEDIIEKIKEISEDGNAKIKMDESSLSESDLKIIREHFSGSKSVKVDVPNKLGEEAEEEDSKYLFIIRREYPIPETIRRYLLLKGKKDIPVEKIEEILTPEEE